MFSNLPVKDDRILIDAKTFKVDKFRNEADRGILNLRFKMNGRYYFFKANSITTKDTPEIMATLLARTIGLEAVEMHEAVFVDTNGKSYKGVISADYVEDRKNTEVINGESLIYKFLPEQKNKRLGAMEFHFSALKVLRNRHNFLRPENQKLQFENKLGLSFAKYVVFYALTGNQDTNSHNFDYVVKHSEGGKKVLSLAPIFDCSYSFLMKTFRKDVYSQVCSDFDDFDKMLVRENLSIIPMALQIEAEQNEIKTRENLLKSLSRLIVKNKELEEFYNNIKQFDTKKFFTEVYESEKHCSITKKDVELASFVFTESVKDLDEQINIQKTIINSPMNLLIKNSTKNSLEL